MLVSEGTPPVHFMLPSGSIVAVPPQVHGSEAGAQAATVSINAKAKHLAVTDGRTAKLHARTSCDPSPWTSLLGTVAVGRRPVRQGGLELATLILALSGAV